MSRVNLTQKILTIDSADRTGGTSSSFDVNIDMPRFNAFNKASVVMCEIPKAYYAADAALTGEVNGFVFSIPVATMQTFMTASTFGTALQTALDASGSGLTYTVTYSSLTGKYTVVASGNIDLDTTNPLLAKYLGIEINTTYPAVLGTTFVSSKIANIQRYDTLFVNCSIISNNNSPRLLTLFPSQTPDLAMIGYTSPAMDLGSVNLTDNGTTSIHVALVDSSGSVVELNGANIRLVLSCYNEQN